jgi:hypothetical protein
MTRAMKFERNAQIKIAGVSRRFLGGQQSSPTASPFDFFR